MKHELVFEDHCKINNTLTEVKGYRYGVIWLIIPRLLPPAVNDLETKYITNVIQECVWNKHANPPQGHNKGNTLWKQWCAIIWKNENYTCWGVANSADARIAYANLVKP